MADTIVSEQKAESTPISRQRAPRRRLRRTLVAAVLVIALAAGAYELWRYFGTYESTDDAQVDGHIQAISARISGHLNEVLVQDAQIVRAGDPLVRIDPKDYQVAVDKAVADLADAQAALESSRTAGADRFYQHGQHFGDRQVGPCR